jgi:hypothetical protein
MESRTDKTSVMLIYELKAGKSGGTIFEVHRGTIYKFKHLKQALSKN